MEKGVLSMNSMIQNSARILCACICISGVSVVCAQSSGAPPATPATFGGVSGKSAGYAGGGGAAGQAGTDPATLKHTEEQRLKKKHAAAGDNGPDNAKRKDYKE
jgi:hypothetical protein